AAQPCDDLHPVAKAIVSDTRRQRERNPNVRNADFRIAERFGKNTNDDVVVSVERDRPGRDRRIAAQTVPPESVAEQHDALISNLLFGVAKGAAKHRLDTQDSEEIRG